MTNKNQIWHENPMVKFDSPNSDGSLDSCQAHEHIQKERDHTMRVRK